MKVLVQEIMKGRKLSKRCFIRVIKYRLHSIRIWTEALTSDWEGTYWKNKKKVLKDLREMTGELNMIYDAMDEFTGDKNERIML